MVIDWGKEIEDIFSNITNVEAFLGEDYEEYNRLHQKFLDACRREEWKLALSLNLEKNHIIHRAYLKQIGKSEKDEQRG